MQNIFRSFERSGTDYLLIGGQASILYGAATFSEDVDVWVRPDRANLARLVRALSACRARVRSLTPPLTERHVRAGHGFHFVLPGPEYLDVMGVPPRVGTFAQARRRAVSLRSPWGDVPGVCIEDLVRLKRTRRHADYDVISNLVRIRIAPEAHPSRPLLRWAARNSFRAEERAHYLARLGQPRGVEACRGDISREILSLQRRDTVYWRRRVHELRRLRRQGRLWTAGSRV